MHVCIKNVFYSFSIFATLGLGSAGCVAEDGDEDPSAAEESAGEQEVTGEAASAYTASTTCTTSGGGTWGSILKMCVSISPSGVGTFTVKKSDGSAFSTAGTMYLKVGTYEPWGVNHATKTLNGGSLVYGVSFSETFSQWPGYPKQYYARWASQAGGYAWVGPITIYQ